MNGRRAILIAAIASFIVGGALGLASGVLLMRFSPGPHARAWHRDGPPRHRMVRSRMLDHLERRLDLTAAQRDRIEAIIETTRNEQESAHDSLRVRIDRVLTDAQRERWRTLERRFGRHGHRRPAGPPDHD